MSRILIVDDERSMRKILASNLVQDGHIVTEAAGVVEATACLASNRFDAVITDQKMPDGQGLDVLARAREIAEGLAKLPPLTSRYTRIALTQKLRRIIDEGVGYGLALEGISAADVARSQAR